MPSLYVRKVLRLSALTMDTLSGAVRWRGEAVALGTEERELLAVMLRRAGQIVSRERLAALIGAAPAAVDRRVAALVRALDAAGVRCRPRVAEGAGYILWY